MPSQNEIRERITHTIIEALTKGGLPPWRHTVAQRQECRLPREHYE